MKRFKRPDAGAPPPAASELRPLPVLRHTVDFLLQLWQRRSEAAPLDLNPNPNPSPNPDPNPDPNPTLTLTLPLTVPSSGRAPRPLRIHQRPATRSHAGHLRAAATTLTLTLILTLTLTLPLTLTVTLTLTSTPTQDISVQRLASAAVELLCRIARFHALMELAFCAAPKVSG